MGLDACGIIAVVQIAMYIPKRGPRPAKRLLTQRNAGWIFLVTISIFRIVAGVTHVLSENDPTNKTERIIYNSMESAGLSRLLMATLGFLQPVTQCSLEDNTLVSTGLKVVGLVGTIGLALTVSGGVSTGNATSQSSLNSATTQRHVCVVLFALMYLGGVTLTALCWQRYCLILRYRRQMLKGIAATFPFLGVHVVYGVLGGFAPSPLTIVNGRQWGTLLVMSVLMEYIAVLVYAVVGVVTPLSKDVPDYRKTDTWSDSYMLYSKLR